MKLLEDIILQSPKSTSRGGYFVMVCQHDIEFCSYSPIKSKWSLTGGTTITSASNEIFFIFGIKYHLFFFVLNEDE
jgi:hypothetical protein